MKVKKLGSEGRPNLPSEHQLRINIMSYDDDNPEVFSSNDEDLLIIELLRQDYPDTFPWFENESDSYEEIINQESEYPYDE